MNDSHSTPIVWREPFRARARFAFEEFRRSWYLPIGAGASLALLGITLLAIWAYNLDEPFSLRAAAVMVAAGLLVIFLLTLDDFIPRTVKLGEKAVRIARPQRPESIRYQDLQGCDLTTGPAPQFRGFGRNSELLFAVFWNPSLDPELLRAFLLTKGIPLGATPQDPAPRLELTPQV
jgi:hypothetical protein